MVTIAQKELLHRYSAMRTTLGRLRLNYLARTHQWLWRCHSASQRVVKRGFDAVASGTFLLVLSPLYLLIALLIRLEDGGPALFTQTRVGRFGREFTMYKFRSMCTDAEARLQEIISQNHHKEGVTFKIKDDPRLTQIGKWLRKYSLDELPQVWNVFVGDMSLVGPRPPLPREVAHYTLADRRRLAVPPGITCLWQIGGRSEIDFSGQVKLDVEYIESAGFTTDVKILFKTVPAVVAAKGAC